MTLLFALILAANPVRMMDEPQVTGWSKDGSSFVWTFLDQSYINVPEDSENMELGETARVAVVYDVSSSTKTEYLVSYKAVRAKNGGYVKSRYVNAPNKAALDAWRRTNPLSLTTGSTGPRGETAEALVNDAPETSWTYLDDSTTRLRVTKAGVEASVEVNDGVGMFVPEHTVDVYWDPTGYRVAIVLWTLPAQTMRGKSPLTAEVYFLDIPRTRVQLLSPPRLDEKAAELAVRLGEANCEVSRAAPKKDRNATVIYAAKGAEADAKAIARLIKGATVEPLTWKPDVELVIALGAPGAR